MSTAQTIEDHAGHGFARWKPLLLIGHEACVDHVNEA